MLHYSRIGLPMGGVFLAGKLLADGSRCAADAIYYLKRGFPFIIQVRKSMLFNHSHETLNRFIYSPITFEFEIKLSTSSHCNYYSQPSFPNMSTKIWSGSVLLSILTITVPIAALFVPLVITQKPIRELPDPDDPDEPNEPEFTDETESDPALGTVNEKYFISNILRSLEQSTDGYVVSRINYSIENGNDTEPVGNELVGNSATSISSSNQIRHTRYQTGGSSQQHREWRNGTSQDYTEYEIVIQKDSIDMQRDNIGAVSSEGPSTQSLGWKPVVPQKESDGLLDVEDEVRNFFPQPTVFKKEDSL